MNEDGSLDELSHKLDTAEERIADLVRQLRKSPSVAPRDIKRWNLWKKLVDFGQDRMR